MGAFIGALGTRTVMEDNIVVIIDAITILEKGKDVFHTRGDKKQNYEWMWKVEIL